MLWWFAPTGVLLGALCAGIAWLASAVFPWSVASVVAVIALAGLSGALHLDGFMDTCDATGSCAPRERALEIMKDPRAGAFAVVGVVSLLALKMAFIASAEDVGLAAVFVAPVFARAVQVGLLWRARYAREEGGMGRTFFDEAAPQHVIAAALVAVAAALATRTAGALLLALPPTVVWAWWVNGRLGGHTGDTVGATSEVAELAFVFAVALIAAAQAT
jgi:adenosylcobinamide-GDP ribazoletransferase